MKPSSIPTKLNITHQWLVWTPKRGNYAGLEKYVCLVQVPTHYREEVLQCVVAGFKKRGGEPHLHLGQITGYQYDNNTTKLMDEDKIALFESMFKTYKKDWEVRRTVQKAKLLLLSIKNNKK